VRVRSASRTFEIDSPAGIFGCEPRLTPALRVSSSARGCTRRTLSWRCSPPSQPSRNVRARRTGHRQRRRLRSPLRTTPPMSRSHRSPTTEGGWPLRRERAGVYQQPRLHLVYLRVGSSPPRWRGRPAGAAVHAFPRAASVPTESLALVLVDEDDANRN
jgi:hypothetical protein